MKRILLVKTSSLGDVIHNLPVIHDIHTHFPDAQIDWVVEESFADIPRLHAGVRHVYTVAMRRWRKHFFSKNTWQEVIKCKRLLSLQDYDVVIDTQGLIKSAVIATCSSGVRHGYDNHSIREPLASCFYHQKYAIPYQQHAVTRNRTLVALSLNYATPNNAPDYGIQANLLSTLEITKALEQPFVVALHGTSRDSKLWPETQWIKLGAALEEKGLKLLLPWASESEYKRAQFISSRLSNALVLPKLSVYQLAGIISQAQVAVGVDTGLSHLAAALNIPTVAIYTDTNPTFTGVMATAQAKVVNLGGIHQVPDFTLVLNAIRQVSSLLV